VTDATGWRPASYDGAVAASFRANPAGGEFRSTTRSRSARVRADLAEPGASDIGDELEALGASPAGTEIVVWERFRHRLSMAGKPIHYVAVGARKVD